MRDGVDGVDQALRRRALKRAPAMTTSGPVEVTGTVSILIPTPVLRGPRRTCVRISGRTASAALAEPGVASAEPLPGQGSAEYFPGLTVTYPPIHTVLIR